MEDPLSDGDYLFTYFGLWSARDIETVSGLLTGLDVRFEVTDFPGADEEVLKAWCAWDETAANPFTGRDLWIHNDDLDKVDTKVVDMFPERKFEA